MCERLVLILQKIMNLLGIDKRARMVERKIVRIAKSLNIKMTFCFLFYHTKRLIECSMALFAVSNHFCFFFH